MTTADTFNIVDASIAVDAMTNTAVDGVGFRESELSYSALGELRTLPLFFWYPSSDEQGDSVRYSGFLPTEEAFKDAALSDVEALPVLLFSHGRRSMGAASVPYMAEHFAKQGWLVVGWEHVGDTTIDGSGENMTYIHRPLDTKAVLDYLFSDTANHPFVGRLSETVVLSGWSRGGFAALALGGATIDTVQNDLSCTEAVSSDFCFAYQNYREHFERGFADERVKALILLASGEYSRFTEGIGNVRVPTIMWTATVDLNNPNEVDGDPIWGALNGENKFRVNIDGAGHFTFSALCPIAGPLGINNGCDDDAFDIPTAHRLINEYNTLFLEAMLFGDAQAQTQLENLSDDALGYEGVHFESKVSE